MSQPRSQSHECVRAKSFFWCSSFFISDQCEKYLFSSFFYTLLFLLLPGTGIIKTIKSSGWKRSLEPPSRIADPSLFIEPGGLVSSLPVWRQFVSVSLVRIPSATVDLLFPSILSPPFPKVSDSPLRAFTITLEYDTGVTIPLSFSYTSV